MGAWLFWRTVYQTEQPDNTTQEQMLDRRFLTDPSSNGSFSYSTFEQWFKLANQPNTWHKHTSPSLMPVEIRSSLASVYAFGLQRVMLHQSNLWNYTKVRRIGRVKVKCCDVLILLQFTYIVTKLKPHSTHQQDPHRQHRHDTDTNH